MPESDVAFLATNYLLQRRQDRVRSITAAQFFRDTGFREGTGIAHPPTMQSTASASRAASHGRDIY